MKNQDRTDRLLATTIAVVFVLGLVTLIAESFAVPEFRATFRLAIAPDLFLVPAFFLARSGHRRVAAWIVAGVTAIAPLCVALGNPADPVALGFEVIGILIASMFVGAREIAILAACQTTAIAVLPLIRPGVYAPPEIFGFAAFTLIVGGVVVVATWHRAALESDRAMLERQLLFRDRLASVGILTAGITHEIRNSLTSVVLSLDALARTIEEDESESQALLRGAQEAARRIKDIVGDLQAFGRADMTGSAPIRLAPIVESSIRISRHALVQRARIAVDIPPDTQAIASEGRLAQVLLNLLINAAQAIPEGHPAENEIRVSARPDGNQVILEVRDTGSGIPEEIRHQIFDPFFTTKGDGGGSGLGLWIIRNLVTDMGGEVRVESSPGRGTTFQIMLRAPEPLPAAEAVRPSA